MAFLSMLSASLLPYRFKSSGPLNPALQSKWKWLVNLFEKVGMEKYAIGWLDFHVFTTFIGYAAFAIAFGASIMYLIKERKTGFLWILSLVLFSTHILIILIRWYKLGQLPIFLNFEYALAGAWLFLGLFALLTEYSRVIGETWSYLVDGFPDARILDELSYRAIAWGFPFLFVGIVSGAIWANYAWGSYWSWDPKETWSLITWFIYAAYLHARVTRGWTGKRAAYLSVVGFMAVIFLYWGVSFVLPGLHAYG
ncbi:MAG: cytochrome c biogenesis protein CcsA [Thermodesulfobacteriota bacterium]